LRPNSFTGDNADELAEKDEFMVRKPLQKRRFVPVEARNSLQSGICSAVRGGAHHA
jgi:hypothetical protein